MLLCNYANIKSALNPELYILQLCEKSLVRVLCKFRIGLYNFSCKLVRSANTETQMNCTHCDLEETENEYHVLLKCTKYSLFTIVNGDYSYQQFINVLNSSQVSTLQSAAFFLKSLFKSQ